MGASDGGEEVGMGEGHDEKIFVSVRLRPLNRKEIARNDVSDWGCINDDTVVYKNANVSMPERSMYPTAYTFGNQMFAQLFYFYFLYSCSFWLFL